MVGSVTLVEELRATPSEHCSNGKPCTRFSSVIQQIKMSEVSRFNFFAN